MADKNFVYAGALLRVGSTIIDAIIADIISFIFSFLATASHASILTLVGTLVSLAFTIYNFIYLPGKEGASIGQRILKIKLVSEETGEPLGYWKVFLRLLVAVVSTLALFLGYLWIIWDKKKQAWHDKAVNAVVVKA